MNLADFNIRNTIEEVQEIQKRQAESKNIELTAEFHGISLSQNNEEEEEVLISPVIYHDEQRII
jgi:hypothetical protein